jgi:Domain of unknown function (DUF4430)
LANLRLHHLPAAIAVAIALALAPATAGAATVHVKLRVEGPVRTVVQAAPVPYVGSIAGHELSGPTVLGALWTASRNHDFPVGLQWFDCCGFYVASINGVPADSTHYWAFKVGHVLAQTGAGSITATNGMSALFYYATFDPVTFATQPTLGLDSSTRTIGAGGQVTFTVTAYDDAGTGTAVDDGWVWVNGVGTKTTPAGKATLHFATAGTYAVKATFPGDIRSRTLWVHVS